MRPNGKDEVSPVRLRRPLFTVGLTYGGCLWLAAAVGFHRALIGAAVAALFFLAALAVRRFRHNEVLLAALLTAVAAFCVFLSREYLTVRPLQRMDGQRVTLTLWLEREQGYTDQSVAYYARVTEGPLPADTRVLVWVKTSEKAPGLYDEISGPMTLLASDRYRADRVYLTAAASGCLVKSSDRRPWDLAFEKWRTSFISGSEGYAVGEAGALIRAVCFGDRSGLSAETKENFAAAGLSHLTAVSGFHMTVITMGLFGLLLRLGLKKRWAALGAWPVPLLFAALTGFSYSAVRAGIMCLILMTGYLFRRRADGKNSLGGAVLAILLADPAAIHDLGFLLSACATLGILLVTGRIAAGNGVAGRMRTILIMTLAALAATLPLTAYYFGSLPLLAPLSNLLGEPLAAVTVVAGCLATLLSGVPALGFIVKPLFLLAGGCCSLLLRIKDVIASLGASLTVDRPYLMLWACALPLLLAAGYRLRGRRGLRIAAMMLVIALLAGKLTDMWGMRGVTSVACCEAEEGSMVLLSREDRQVLVLCGAPRQDEVSRMLKRQGADRIDLLIGPAAVTADIPADNRLEKGSALIWDGGSVETGDGWTFFTLSQTGLLICPYGGDHLPEDYDRATAAVFDRMPPQDADSLAALQGVVCCGGEELPETAGSLPWGRYPLAVTGGKTVKLYTRGLGDCTVKEKGYALE